MLILKRVSAIFILFFILFPAKGQNKLQAAFSMNLAVKATFIDPYTLEDYKESFEFHSNQGNDTIVNSELSRFYNYSYKRDHFLFEIPTGEVCKYFFTICKDTNLNFEMPKSEVIKIPIQKGIKPYAYGQYIRGHLDSIYWSVSNNILFVSLHYSDYANAHTCCDNIKSKQLFIDLTTGKSLSLEDFFNDSCKVSFIEKLRKSVQEYIYPTNRKSYIDTNLALLNSRFIFQRNYIIGENRGLILYLPFIRKGYYIDDPLNYNIEIKRIDFTYEQLGINKLSVKKIFHPYFFKIN